MKKRLGELLIESGLITSEQLADALALQRQRGIRLGAALVERGHLSESQLVEALGRVLRIRVVDLGKIQPDTHAIAAINGDFAAMHDLFPFATRGDPGHVTLTVAMSDPMNYRVIDELSFVANARIDPVLAKASDINHAILRYYGVGGAQPGDTSEMVIIRTGQGSGQSEQTINTSTGPAKMENAPVNLADDLRDELGPKAREEISAVLLTEEVEDSVPIDEEIRIEGLDEPLHARESGAKNLARIKPIRRGDSNSPIPLTEVKMRPPVPVAPPSTEIPALQMPTAPLPPGGLRGFGSGTADLPVTQAPAGQAPVSQANQAQIQGPRSQDDSPVIMGPGPSPVGPANQGVITGTPVSAGPATPTLNAPPPQSPQQGQHGQFNDALGALIDAAGGAVSAEQINDLERKFWALMRVLARKGLITPEEFQAELNADSRMLRR